MAGDQRTGTRRPPRTAAATSSAARRTCAICSAVSGPSGICTHRCSTPSQGAVPVTHVQADDQVEVVAHDGRHPHPFGVPVVMSAHPQKRDDLVSRCFGVGCPPALGPHGLALRTAARRGGPGTINESRVHRIVAITVPSPRSPGRGSGGPQFRQVNRRERIAIKPHEARLGRRRRLRPRRVRRTSRSPPGRPTCRTGAPAWRPGRSGIPQWSCRSTTEHGIAGIRRTTRPEYPHSGPGGPRPNKLRVVRERTRVIRTLSSGSSKRGHAWANPSIRTWCGAWIDGNRTHGTSSAAARAAQPDVLPRAVQPVSPVGVDLGRLDGQAVGRAAVRDLTHGGLQLLRGLPADVPCSALDLPAWWHAHARRRTRRRHRRFVRFSSRPTFRIRARSPVSSGRTRSARHVRWETNVVHPGPSLLRASRTSPPPPGLRSTPCPQKAHGKVKHSKLSGRMSSLTRAGGESLRTCATTASISAPTGGNTSCSSPPFSSRPNCPMMSIEAPTSGWPTISVTTPHG